MFGDDTFTKGAVRLGLFSFVVRFDPLLLKGETNRIFVRFLSLGEGETLALKEFRLFFGLCKEVLSVRRVGNRGFGDGCVDGE